MAASSTPPTASSTSSSQFPDEQGSDGSFQRQDSRFRDWVRADGSSAYPAVADRYHLYVSKACPWAHRTLLARSLMGLEEVLGVTVVDPVRDERGWAFRDGPGHSTDPVNGFQFLSEAYRANDPDFDERVTVPVLWDKREGRIVNNESSEILRMLGTEFRALARHPVDLYPPELADEIDRINDFVYPRVNNGVYRAGFATTQAAYAQAVNELFDALDALDARLEQERFLVAAHPTEADWRLFTTLIRFDAVYVGHFKCNVRRVADYPQLSGYLRDLYNQDGVAETVDFDHIKRHYYVTHDQINPTGIVPVGPALDLSVPHERVERFLPTS
jgi:putative glutathione S-transferase